MKKILYTLKSHHMLCDAEQNMSESDTKSTGFGLKNAFRIKF